MRARGTNTHLPHLNRSDEVRVIYQLRCKKSKEEEEWNIRNETENGSIKRVSPCASALFHFIIFYSCISNVTITVQTTTEWFLCEFFVLRCYSRSRHPFIMSCQTWTRALALSLAFAQNFNFSIWNSERVFLSLFHVASLLKSKLLLSFENI